MDFQGYYEFTKTMKVKIIEELSQKDWVYSIKEKDGKLICMIKDEGQYMFHFGLEKENAIYQIQILNEEGVHFSPLQNIVEEVVVRFNPTFFVMINEEFVQHTNFHQKIKEVYEVFEFQFRSKNVIASDMNLFFEPLTFVANEKEQVVEVWIKGILYQKIQNKEEAVAFKKFIIGEEFHKLLMSLAEEFPYISRMRTNGYRYLCTYVFPFQCRFRVRIEYQFDLERGFYYQIEVRVADTTFFNKITTKELNEETKSRLRTEIQHIYENLKCKKEIIEEFVKTTPYSFLLDHKTFWLSVDEVSGFDINIYTHVSQNDAISYQADVWLCFGKGNVTITGDDKEEIKQKAIENLRKSIAARRMEVLMGSKNENRKWGKIYTYFNKNHGAPLSWVYDGIRTEEEAKQELLNHFKDKWLLARRYERPIETEHFIFEENGSNTIQIQDKKILI